MSRSISITTESGGRQNIFPTEVKTQLVEEYTNYPAEAEKANGRWAMLGFIALIGAYATTARSFLGFFKMNIDIFLIYFLVLTSLFLVGYI